MKTDPFTMYDAVVATPDVRHIVAIMFGRTDLPFIKEVLEKSGYPFGAPESWAKQLREIHSMWLNKGKTLVGVQGYLGVIANPA